MSPTAACALTWLMLGQPCSTPDAAAPAQQEPVAKFDLGVYTVPDGERLPGQNRPSPEAGPPPAKPSPPAPAARREPDPIAPPPKPEPAVAPAPTKPKDAPKAEASAPKQDQRIRIVPYDPNVITVIYAEVGDTLTLEFPVSEKVEDVALSDSRFLQKATKGENFVYLKAMMDLTAQSAFIKTRRADGTPKLYVLQIQTRTPEEGIYFLVRFVDPVADQIARVAAAQGKRPVRTVRHFQL